MANMLLVKPIVAGAVAASTGANAANLLTPDPKEAWSSTAAGAASNLDFDFGAGISIDSVFIGFIGNAAAPTVSWTSGAAAYTTTNRLATTSALAPSRLASPPRRHGFWRTAAPFSDRFHRLVFTPNVAATVTIGIVVFGLALQTTYNREWGAGRRIIDTGEVERLPGGGFGLGDGAVKGAFSWTWGDLTDAEVDAIYGVGLDRGTRRPIVVVEDPADAAGLNEGLHYSLFDRFEPYERQNPNLTRWSLSVEQWV
ncbi:MAG TPA: hypothetical protein VEC11_07830 [Allosphingosinicella sp.]|nr:hypothetical protein [Allosphingosinicella sp.]